MCTSVANCFCRGITILNFGLNCLPAVNVFATDFFCFLILGSILPIDGNGVRLSQFFSSTTSSLA